MRDYILLTACCVSALGAWNAVAAQESFPDWPGLPKVDASDSTCAQAEAKVRRGLALRDEYDRAHRAGRAPMHRHPAGL